MTSSGTIIKGVGGAYTVATDHGNMVCTARGIFRNRQITPLVGDYVEIDMIDIQKKTGVLHTIFSRKNELTRPKAANLDQAVIIMAAAKPAFDRGLLDRFLLLAEYAGISPIICINKCDLKIEEQNFIPYADAGYPLFFTSTKTSEGMEALRKTMHNKISVFAGPSGVGKSSLINFISGNANRETGNLSEKINRGKHTTRHTELIPLPLSGFVVDTPGFTSLDVNTIPTDVLASLFREFIPFLGKCRFTNCRHDKESDCAVKAQVGAAVHPLRYESYINFLQKR